MSIKSSLGAGAAAAVLLFAGGALANPTNVDEPSGTVILDLDGGPISSSWTTVNTSFVAGAATTDIGFAFRDDPSFIHFDNASVTTGGGGNLLTNGDFATGDLTGWTYQNPQAATFSGVVSGQSWVDGSVQAYDTLDQIISTTVGATYNVSFDYFEGSDLPFFSRLSTNGHVTGTNGNGINIVVYAGGASPVLQGGVPEPASWALMVLGFGGLGVALRNRRQTAAVTA